MYLRRRDASGVVQRVGDGPHVVLGGHRCVDPRLPLTWARPSFGRSTLAPISQTGRYSGGMTPAVARSSTTIKLSTETRDRIRALDGDTYEETIVEALDALEDAQFWAQAEAAAAWEASLPEEERRRLRAETDAIDAAFDGIG